MAQASFTYNGEQYIVDNSSSPPSLWRMSAQGPVQMSTSNPGWGGPELRQKANQALLSLGNQPNPAPATPSSSTAFGNSPRPGPAPGISGMTLPPTGAGQAAGITVGRDPSDPNKLIWVDRQTGLPAPQPGGAGSPYTTQDTADAQAATAQAGAQGVANRAATGGAAQQRILAQYGRTGWTVTGSHDATDAQRVMDSEGNYVTKQVPNGNTVWTIAGPGGKSDEIVVKPTGDGDFTPIKGPTNATLPPQLSAKDAQYVKGEGYFLPIDPSPEKLGDPSNWRKILPDGVPNADDEIKKAVERQVAEGDRNARQRNEAQYGIYADDATAQRLMVEWANSGLRGQELQQKKDEFNKTFAEGQRQFDIKQAAEDKKTQDQLLTGQANRALTGAQTINTQATTAQTQATTQRTQALLPGEVEKQGADIEDVRARAAQTRQATQIAAAPTMQGTVGGGPYITQRNPLTGDVRQSQIDLNYEPKTQAQIAARVGQLHNLIQQQSDRVQGKVGQMINGVKYTPEDANKEFNSWYASQIEPQIGGLEAARDDAAFARGKDLAAMRATALQQANAVGTSAVNAVNILRQMHPVDNPDAYNAAVKSLSQGKVPDNYAQATSWTGPDPVALQQQALQNALKYLDPTIAQQAGAPQPNYQKMDIRALTANPYAAPGVAGPPPNVPGPGIPSRPDLAVAASTGNNSLRDQAGFGPQYGLNLYDIGAQPTNDPGFTNPPNVPGFKPGWAGSDPRFSGNLNPLQWTPPGGADYMSTSTPPWLGAQPQTLLQQYGTPNPWEVMPYVYGA